MLYQYLKWEYLPNVYNNVVGLRSPERFNDPFECSIASVPPSLNAEAQLEWMGRNRDLSDELRESVRRTQGIAAGLRVGMNCVVLCLTRTPLNQLMWAHYAQGNGLVVGYDTNSDFFRGLHNLCPVQHGGIIYAATRPNPIFEEEDTEPSDSWMHHPFAVENLERIQTTFLYKAQPWHYEEEVRVVKRLNDEAEQDIRTHDEKKDIWFYDLPPASIKEVYIQMHWMTVQRLKNRELEPTFWHVVDRLSAKGITTRLVVAGRDSWEFETMAPPGPAEELGE